MMEDYWAEGDMHTLKEAIEILQNPDRSKAAQAAAREKIEQMEDLTALSDADFNKLKKALIADNDRRNMLGAQT